MLPQAGCQKIGFYLLGAGGGGSKSKVSNDVLGLFRERLGQDGCSPSKARTYLKQDAQFRIRRSKKCEKVFLKKE